MTDNDIKLFGASVMSAESASIKKSISLQSTSFVVACRCVADCEGKIVVSGVGKAGLIGKKISATMASTGTPSIWLDPINALHGDLGMVDQRDVTLLISNSGSSGELLLTAKGLHALGVKQIAMTKSKDTLLSKLCDLTLELGQHKEACPLNLSPSTSTSVMLALGDAVALTVQKMKNFSQDDYARYHPAGALGRRVVAVKHLMRTDDKIAVVSCDAIIGNAMQSITRARCGLCIVLDNAGKLKGVYTDGDFRRDWSSGVDISTEPVSNHMNKTPKSILCTASGSEALDIMHKLRVNSLPVLDEQGFVCGLVDIQDLV